MLKLWSFPIENLMIWQYLKKEMIVCCLDMSRTVGRRPKWQTGDSRANKIHNMNTKVRVCFLFFQALDTVMFCCCSFSDSSNK